jgi:DnaJ-domain-containing protein 1
MGLWERLGNVIKSYLNDDDEQVFGGRQGFSATGDADFDAAYSELDDFLNKGSASAAHSGASRPGNAYQNKNQHIKPVPEALRPDFAELEVPFGAGADECKAAYKRLLKIHHPDRHASDLSDKSGHEGSFQKATEKTARLNAAYDRIEKWRAAL